MSAAVRPAFGVLLCLAVVTAFAARAQVLPTAGDQARVPGGAAISGAARDDSGQPIPGVTITVARAGEQSGGNVVVTDMAGAFNVTGLRPGSYVLEAALEGFQQVSRTVTLVTGQTINVKLKLAPAFSQRVDVVARAPRTGEVAILETRRQSAVVSDSVSAEEIRKTPDSSAAGVVERLTGVTLLSGKYVFVRGLGERYSGTTINGATLPTTETESRVVPLDLFPAKLLSSVNIVKTYTPDKPGDFGSGVVEMTTTEFPRSQTLKVTLGAGYDSSATANGFRRYAGGLDWLGRGGQPLPAGIPNEFIQRKSSLSNTGFSPEELQKFGRSLVGDWTGSRASSAPPAADFALTYGNTFDRLGVVLSAVTNHKYQTTDEVQRYFGLDAGGILVPNNDFALTTDREGSNSGLLGNLSLRLSDTNVLFLNSVLTRDASNENRFQTGINGASGGEIRDFRGRYQIEQVFSTRLRGEHNLPGPGIGSLIEWSGAHSRATNESNLRENLYREASPGEFTLQVGYSSSGELDYYHLADDINQGGLAYTAFYAREGGAWSGSVKGGFDILRRTRNFGARRFAFTTPDQTQFDLTKTPEQLFTAENIRPGGFELREVTGINDAYDASHTIRAGYLMADSTFGKLRLIGGARYENSDQSVSTFNPFDTRNPVRSINQQNDLLSSLNLVYQTSTSTNLRFGYGRTVNRPEFRELSPFAFVEVTGGRSIAGNPDLKEAKLDSYDLRWETFPDAGSVIAASTFYKKIRRPIERIIQPTSDFRTSFINADSATLYGAEVELRRGLAIVSPALRDWSVNANYAWIKSDVVVGLQQLEATTSANRPLQGQADQSGNLALQFFRPGPGTLVRLLGAYIGRRLSDVGAFGLPDIYEQPYTSIDAVVSQRIDHLANGLDLKLAVNNLLDRKREFIQSRYVQRSYIPGRTISISISYTPF